MTQSTLEQIKNALENKKEQEVLRLKDAASYLNISLTSLWRICQNDPLAPPKIRITSRCCVMRKADLDAYLESKKGA
ncbi:helix-turn-helix domain-containing protein [Catenovulum agarivorans]|uniref:helix-turn-helix transcriptional regulator n=1 Tax=Catenovulum agarivorans TaxID=1172192 RepID=UPI0003635D63